jgi:membrane protein required for colicin V production
LSFLILFCGVFIIISILGIIINYLLKIAFLSWLDRILGSVFGAMKGVLIVSVLFIALTAFLPKGTPVIKDSLLSPYVTLVSEKIAKVVSKDMKHAFSAKIATIKKAWKKNK